LVQKASQALCFRWIGPGQAVQCGRLYDLVIARNPPVGSDFSADDALPIASHHFSPLIPDSARSGVQKSPNGDEAEYE
jgi:hypothetical protein